MTPTDRELALTRLCALVGTLDPAETTFVVHPGRPMPKARARWSPRNQSWYTPTTTTTAETAVAWAWRTARVGRRPYTDTLALVALFYMASDKWTAGDGDNCLKLVMDAGNKARIWTDDRQVKAATWVIDLDAANPRTVLACAPVLNALTRAPLLMAPKGS